MDANGRVKNRIVRSEADWKTILEEYDRSGQSRAAFCRKAGVSSSTFQLWERKLRLRGGRAASAGFVEVMPPARPEGRWLVEFHFPDGTRAQVRG